MAPSNSLDISSMSAMRRLASLALLACALSLASVQAQEPMDAPSPVPAQATTETPPASQQQARPASGLNRQQVHSALVKVRADPALGSVKHDKTLRFKDFEFDRDPPEKTTKPEAKPAWLVDFAVWITHAGSVFVWVLGALLVAIIAATAHRWLGLRGAPLKDRSLAALPSHVRDLDIRPQSLPDRIGDAARALWLRGEQHAALSLLYRGTLSRLVHQHAVPIRAASTEGECVQLAQGRVSTECSLYLGELVRAWQLAVYGARLPEHEPALALCDSFERHLGHPQPATTAAGVAS